MTDWQFWIRIAVGAIWAFILLYIAITVTVPISRAKRKYGQEFLFRDRFLHVSGLNLPDGTKCEVICLKNRVVIEANGMKFSLSSEKIVDVSIMRKKELQKMFGRADLAYRMRIVSENKYLVFTYIPNPENTAETQFLIFAITGKETNVGKFKRRFRQSKQKTGIQVDL